MGWVVLGGRGRICWEIPSIFVNTSVLLLFHFPSFTGGPDTKFAPAGFYKNASWVLCPPTTVCPAGVEQINKPFKAALRGND